MPLPAPGSVKLQLVPLTEAVPIAAPLRSTRSTWPLPSAAPTVPCSVGVASVVVEPAAITAFASFRSCVIVASIRNVGSAELGGCAQLSAGSLSGRATTLLWQLAHTVPGGVNTWPRGIEQALLTTGGGTGVLRGGRLVPFTQVSQPFGNSGAGGCRFGLWHFSHTVSAWISDGPLLPPPWMSVGGWHTSVVVGGSGVSGHPFSAMWHDAQSGRGACPCGRRCSVGLAGSNSSATRPRTFHMPPR